MAGPYITGVQELRKCGELTIEEGGYYGKADIQNR